MKRSVNWNLPNREEEQIADFEDVLVLCGCTQAETAKWRYHS
jgi:hypothetical protein